MTLVQTWVEAAYNRSASNDPGKLAQDGELLDHLNRVFQRFYALFAKARPDEAGSLVTYALTGSPGVVYIPPDTIALVSVKKASTGAQVHIIPASETSKLWHATSASPSP